MSDIQAGDVVEHQGHKYLVGDVNDLGGICDCCREFRPRDPEVRVLGNALDDPSLLEELRR